MSSRYVALFVVSVVSTVACGDGSSDRRLDALATPVPDASPDAGPDASPDGPPDAPPVRCATDRVVHLDVHRVVDGATIPDGRIVVRFHQFNDDIRPRPTFFGYDRPYNGASNGVDIAISEIALPAPIDGYQLCERSCNDLTDPACSCPAGAPKLALGAVFVVRDSNHSGAIEAEELNDDDIYGIGWMQLGASDAAYPPPTALDSLAPQGIQDCLAPYSILPPAPGGFNERLGVPSPSETFRLDICVPDSDSCDLVRSPNLT